MALDPEDDINLMTALQEIAFQSPRVKLEHVTPDPEERAEAWRSPERRILPVERWLEIVWKDYRNAPSPEAQYVIMGPHYRWHRDELGRAIILANHQGEFVPMFEEVWAGDPLS